jgi:membrane-associated phospholipid phosphatase
VLSGVIFLLIPAQLGYTRATAPDTLFGLLGLIHALDHPHNLVPSLHVIISGLIFAALHGASPTWLRHAFAVWFMLICVSVILVHQHHILDVIGGVLVTWFLMRSGRKRGAP